MLTIGVAAFVVSVVVDGARNLSDVNELRAAAHARYGVDIDPAQAVVLFQSVSDDRPTELTGPPLRTTALKVVQSTSPSRLREFDSMDDAGGYSPGMFAIACWVLGGVAVLVAVAIVIGARRAYRRRGLESVGDPVSTRAGLQDVDAAVGLQRNSTAGYPR